MDATEQPSHSFILKIWLEQTVEEAGHTVWRGHLTHVPGGERRYVRSLAEVSAVLRPYLEQMGVETPMLTKVLRWLLRQRAR